jgi:hypothetical protein
VGDSSSRSRKRCIVTRVCTEGAVVCADDGVEVEPVDCGLSTHAFHCTVSVDEPINPLWFALHYGYDGSGASAQPRRRK